MTTKKLSRKEREYMQRRKEILDTALDLFSKKGFHNVSMNEIASVSEFAVGTLYNFFTNKEDLYCALVDEKIMEIYNAVKDALDAPGTEEEIIEKWITAKIDIYNENVDCLRLFLAETMGIHFSVKTSITDKIKEKKEDIHKRVSKVFERGIKKGVFADIDPYILTVSLDGICNALVYEQVDDRLKNELTARTILDIFFKNILLRK